MSIISTLTALLLLLMSMGAIVVGVLFLSEATMGVEIIAIAGVIGIYARIAQADANHRKMLNSLKG